MLAHKGRGQHGITWKLWKTSLQSDHAEPEKNRDLTYQPVLNIYLWENFILEMENIMIKFLCSSILWLLDRSIYQFIQSEDGFHKPKLTTGKPTTVMLWKYIPEVPREWTWNWIWNNGLIQNQKMRTSRLFVSSCLFNLYAEYIMQNAWLDEAQAGIKIAGRNISNLKYADDTILMAESEEEL